MASATKTSYVKENVPEQFYEVGIAEANMVGIAAGLASQNLKPFVSSFAMFLAGRAFEQIRNSVAYPHLNVKLCASHAGISVGEDGASHQCLEDLSLMRTLPGMVVLQPCDAIETRAMVKWMVDYEGPCYMRLSRFAVENVLNPEYTFSLGKIKQLKQGKRIALLATGLMVQESLKAVKDLNVSVYNVSTIKPMDKKALKKIADLHDCIITLEEHNVIGGLYSSVCEIVHNKPIYPIGIKDVFGESGDVKSLFRKYGLDSEMILSYVQAVNKMIE